MYAIFDLGALVYWAVLTARPGTRPEGACGR
jgi:hypothetical protein